MNNNNTILALVFLMALLTTAAVITMGVPATYAEEDDHDDDNGDGYGNKIKAEDESQVALADCDNNDVERVGFDCVAIEENGLVLPPMGPPGIERVQ